MSRESSKTRIIRGADFIKTYLSGKVIDIGCGPDLVVDHAEPFDLPDGDAGMIARYRPLGSYDAVHSSHCLEHMVDVPVAIQQWWSLVKVGGYLVVVVPEEDLYEQGIWPSLFNPDHKATFRLRRPTEWSEISYDIAALAESLPGGELVSAELHEQGYDRTLMRRGVGIWGRFLHRINGLRTRVFRGIGLGGRLVEKLMNRLFFSIGAPIDQLEGDAVAQIQIVVRKVF